MSLFKKASKQQARAKIAMTGPSGSGKTLSALRLAHGLGGRVAVIDTENNSASLYSDKFGDWAYDVAVIPPPYTAAKYFAAIDEAIAAKYDVLIIDSISHMWAGEGGLLEQKSALDSRGGNSYTNWNSITKIQERFKSILQNSPIHLIATMRSKQDYILETNSSGKQAPKKVGLAPIQREGMEYEFTVVFDIGMDHQFIVSKDRTSLFDGVVEMITEKTGETIKNWLSDDKSAESSAAESVRADIASALEDQKEESEDDHSEHVVTFGKFKGQRLKDVDIYELASYVNYVETKAQEEGKPIKGTVATFMFSAHKFLASRKPSSLMDDIEQGKHA